MCALQQAQILFLALATLYFVQFWLLSGLEQGGVRPILLVQFVNDVINFLPHAHVFGRVHSFPMLVASNVLLVLAALKVIVAGGAVRVSLVGLGHLYLIPVFSQLM